MPFTSWTGKAKDAKKRTGGISPLTPTELAPKLNAAGWTEVTMTISGKVVKP